MIGPEPRHPTHACHGTWSTASNCRLGPRNMWMWSHDEGTKKAKEKRSCNYAMCWNSWMWSHDEERKKEKSSSNYGCCSRTRRGKRRFIFCTRPYFISQTTSSVWDALTNCMICTVHPFAPDVGFQAELIERLFSSRLEDIPCTKSFLVDMQVYLRRVNRPIHSDNGTWSMRFHAWVVPFIDLMRSTRNLTTA
jgi:hypothetical protein